MARKYFSLITITPQIQIKPCSCNFKIRSSICIPCYGQVNYILGRATLLPASCFLPNRSGGKPLESCVGGGCVPQPAWSVPRAADARVPRGLHHKMPFQVGPAGCPPCARAADLPLRQFLLIFASSSCNCCSLRFMVRNKLASVPISLPKIPTYST